MAIFTNPADRDLPMLTQFAQLDATNPAEIERFYSKQGINAKYINDAERETLPDIRAFVHEVLVLLAKNELHLPENEYYIIKFNELYGLVPPGIMSRAMLQQRGLDIKDNDFAEMYDRGPNGTFLVCKIVALLRMTILDTRLRSLVGICIECGHPFLAHRESREYCSYRCAARAGARDRRKRSLQPKEDFTSNLLNCL